MIRILRRRKFLRNLENFAWSFHGADILHRETNRTVRNQYKLNLNVSKVNQVSYGEKGLRYYGRKMWNSLPFQFKTSENLKTFRDIIKNWNGSTCNCRVCQNWMSELSRVCQNWTELILSSKFFLLVQHLLILYTPHIKF